MGTCDAVLYGFLRRKRLRRGSRGDNARAEKRDTIENLMRFYEAFMPMAAGALGPLWQQCGSIKGLTTFHTLFMRNETLACSLYAFKHECLLKPILLYQSRKPVCKISKYSKACQPSNNTNVENIAPNVKM